jgi:hypothetical protein
MANTIWVNVYDENGNRVNTTVRVRNVNGTEEVLPFKPGEPYNRPMWKNDKLDIWVDDGPSDTVQNLHGAYWNIPGVNTYHVGYILTFKRCVMPEENTVPEPPLEPPTPSEITEEHIRNATWNRLYPSGGIDFNPSAAFQAVARARGLGVPVTQEFDIGSVVRVQGFAEAILWAYIGQWGDVSELAW